MKYISFEGPDGFGKSTTLADCRKFFKSLDPVYVKEPGGTPQGKRLQKVIVSPKSAKMDPYTMSYLMATARYDVISHKVAPSLRAGKFVVSDRCLLSSYAYQGLGAKRAYKQKTMDENILHPITDINNFATCGFKYLPSLVFLFTTTSVKTIQDRLKNRPEKADRVDKQLAEKSQAIVTLQRAYQNAAKYWNLHFGNRSEIVVIDAAWTRKQRRDAVIKNVKKLANP